MRCGVTGKVMFRSHKAALIRASEIVEEQTNRRISPDQWRAYQCEFCGGFHLTGKILQFIPREPYAKKSRTN